MSDVRIYVVSPAWTGAFVSAAVAFLSCEGECEGATEHAFREQIPTGRKSVELRYACLRCRTTRRWGVEALDDEAVSA